MLKRLRQDLSIVVLAVWWGGLTFYAMIVVPIGAEQIGSAAQGMITQQVTNWLNACGALALALTVWDLRPVRRPLLTVTWTVLAVSLAAVVAMHGRLDAMIDTADHSISDSQRFYAEHRIYLLITTVQWGVGLVYGWGLNRAQKGPDVASSSIEAEDRC